MSANDSTNEHVRIAVIGAGPGGICTGYRLLERGTTDFVILEKGTTVGGTWYHNRYPGAACDIAVAPLLLLLRDEARLEPALRDPAGDLRLPPAAAPRSTASSPTSASTPRFGHVLGRGVPGAGGSLAESGDEIVADVVVSAIGMFCDLSYPDISGLDSFKGTTFHSARWNYDHDLSGERVAVIGNAASAVQFVPEIAEDVGQLHLFQRTANWVLPKDDDPVRRRDARAVPERPRRGRRLA